VSKSSVLRAWSARAALMTSSKAATNNEALAFGFCELSDGD